MISPSQFHQALEAAGVEFFSGVPDSLLREFGTHIDAAVSADQHVIAANEGTAIALAAGYHLATGTTPLVYMQNSGLGNAVNPLLSLVDPEVYGLPVVLLIGWRGEPDVADEPQHVKQGRVTPALLEAMDVPFSVMGPEQVSDEIIRVARDAVELARQRRGPVALLVRKNVFEKSEIRRPRVENFAMSRERSIEQILDALPLGTTIVSTTGMISRELYELRQEKNQGHDSDFLTVGSMGHASQIALGISIAARQKLVVCLDGDGAAIMQMGGLTGIAAVGPKRFIHIILNNGVHDSVGGQPTAGFSSDLSGIARAAGYRHVAAPVDSEVDLSRAVLRLLDVEGPSMLEVKLAPGSRSDLGRPKETPAENMKIFAERLRGKD